MNSLLTNLLKIFRWLLGVVFVFSGFVKLIDPLGTAYKFQDYFAVMGLERLSGSALVFAVALSVIELLIGLNLLAGIRLKITMITAAVFMIVMTPLTLWIALKNPVSDCGCFGDALVIGNWATFDKNIILSLLVIAIFILMRYHTVILKPKAEWVLMGYSLIFAMAFAHVNYHYLPMIDFRPYKIGKNLPKEMAVPPGAQANVYSTTFTLEKNGVQKEFSLENYPDSTWTFVAQHTRLIKKGFTPAIHDFSIRDANMNDLTDSILNLNKYLFLLVSYDLDQMSTNHLARIEHIYQFAQQNHYAFYMLTGSASDVIAHFQQVNKVGFPICTTDPTTLKTMIRSNPGLILLYHGTVLNKWSNDALPRLTDPLSSNPNDETPSIPSAWEALGFAVLYIILFWVIRLWLTTKYKQSKNSYYQTTN
ncbi:BT_3928 family protein [Microbacter margulisiae]|uniref:Putative membrane protein YphA (DoxX/SURF4 family) n=1 Tax=Microbacter margulisiae TaxID=1350067 RepID=A0A7W5DSV7_9PORP|nr:BT_3928 family protein [Microbacter margulisiae]MBB3188455.1 putative membrane protein YphA (DoxX/SURF4 family) [Microbacter margulisiae]